MVDLGGSLAVASRGLFATGVSTDLNGKTNIYKRKTERNPHANEMLRAVTYLSSGGKIGDLIKAEVTCDKCISPLSFPSRLFLFYGKQLLMHTVGKTLAYTSIKFMNSKEEVFARGSHTKYIALAWKDPKNIPDELTPKSEKKE